jgi:hypothetical protein
MLNLKEDLLQLLGIQVTFVIDTFHWLVIIYLLLGLPTDLGLRPR